MKYFALVILLLVIVSPSMAQKCPRPDEVFVKLSPSDSMIVSNHFVNDKVQMYLQDSTEIFIRESGFIGIGEVEHTSLKLQILEQLRQKEREIRRCEVRYLQA